MSNIKVCIKIHPLSQRDIKSKKEEQWRVTDNNSLQCINSEHPCKFTFDYVFGTKSLNCEVYLSLVKPIFESCLIGFNGTIIAYGSSSAGKNYTMIGTNMDPGILLTTIEQLFIQIGGSPHHTIRFGYIEIYKEKIYDLLNDRQPVLMDQNEKFDFMLSNEEIVVENFEKAVETVINGSYKRKSAAEDSSKLSSLSHSILRITIQSEDKASGKMLVSYLRFVHVAGCEVMIKNPSIDSLQDESNRSLYWFNSVIDELNKGEKNINFNNSIMTTLLRESVAGKSNTGIICSIRADCIDETISALKFVSQAKEVRTMPIRNEMYNVRESCSPVSAIGIQLIDMENQLKQIADLKVENLLLRNELEEEKAATAVKKKWFIDQMKSTEFAQQKLEHDLMEQKRIQSELEFKINHLTNLNESLLAKLGESKEGTAVGPLRPNESIRLNNGTTLMGGNYQHVDNRRSHREIEIRNGEGSNHVDNRRLYPKIETRNRKGPNHVDHRRSHQQIETRNGEGSNHVDNQRIHPEIETQDGYGPNYVDNRRVHQQIETRNGVGPNHVDNRRFHPEIETRNGQSSNHVDNRRLHQQIETRKEEGPNHVDNRRLHKESETRNGYGPNSVDNRELYHEIETRNKRKSRDSSESDWSECNKAQKCEVNCEETAVNSSPFTELNRIRNRDKSETCTLTVQNSLIGRLIGRGGCRLNNIRSATGTSILISERNGEPIRNVTVNGNSYAVSKAVDMIKERLETDD